MEKHLKFISHSIVLQTNRKRPQGERSGEGEEPSASSQTSQAASSPQNQNDGSVSDGSSRSSTPQVSSVFSRCFNMRSPMRYTFREIEFLSKLYDVLKEREMNVFA